MQQMALFADTGHASPANVACVPQISPFRYPGGKTWMVPLIRRWLAPALRQRGGSTPVRPARLIEPFAGGGSISLTAVAENLVEHAVMVELDEDVAAVWQTILDEEHAFWLLHEIETFQVTAENVECYLARTAFTQRERAFRTILRNRVNRAGILAPGAGLLKRGENGRGLLSRWYPATLKKRIERIWQMRERITFIQGDGMELLRSCARDHDAAFFIDPPYTVAGKKAGSRLYTCFELDHRQLFDLVQTLQGDFLMTYDDTQEVRTLARLHHFETQAVPMRNSHHAELAELLIGSNLRRVLLAEEDPGERCRQNRNQP
ncbi:MAG TPA: DNA adenine methylase [Ktedonobacteraceae bacterium]